ncbi:DUF2917 domain-containing protein [Verrucomicrobiota bacterium sgz303538]
MNTNCLSDAPTALAFATADAQSRASVSPIVLEAQGLWRSSEHHAGVTVQVVEGTVWITAEGDPQDYILHEGQAFRSFGRNRVVAQSLCGRSRMVVQN